MRIDRFLYFVRLLKSRTGAQALIEEGRVRLNGRHVVKASEEVQAGSVLAFPLRGQVRIIRVLAMPVRRGPPAEARACYEEVAESSDSANVSQQGPAD